MTKGRQEAIYPIHRLTLSKNNNNQGETMSKAKETEVVEEVKTNNVAKTENNPKEIIETLRVQLREHLQQAEFHRTMSTKAQGALEVLLQLHPEEDSGEGS